MISTKSNVKTSKVKKIYIRQISNEYRGAVFFGSIVWFPWSTTIDWPEIWGS